MYVIIEHVHGYRDLGRSCKIFDREKSDFLRR